MRDVQVLSIGEETVVVASDNSGSIGLKELDTVKVPYEVVGYYTLRVAMMECICAGAEPKAVILTNFCGDEAWEGLERGIVKGLQELELSNLSISGSTESNFSLVQSAIGLTVLGKKKAEKPLEAIPFQENTKVAVIGLPLVGNEVVEQEYDVAPLAMVKEMCELDEAVLLPVGSKGILYELNQMFTNRKYIGSNIDCILDLYKTSGPSTCFLAAFPDELTSAVKKIAGRHYRELVFSTK